ncbi:MAG: hypothetical protein WAV26_01870 [Candidatus Deferrimicrobium sp.]
MDQNEYEARLVAIEQLVETLARGYHRGNHFQILGGLKESAQAHEPAKSQEDLGIFHAHLSFGNVRGLQKKEG